MAITWNSSDKGSGLTLSGGNLTVEMTSGDGASYGVRSAALTGGKLYFEFTFTTVAAYDGDAGIGVAAMTGTRDTWAGNGDTSCLRTDGQIGIDYSIVGSLSALANGDVVRIGVDVANETIKFAINGGSESSAYNFSGMTGTTVGLFFTANKVGAKGTLNAGATAFSYSPFSGYEGPDAGGGSYSVAASMAATGALASAIGATRPLASGFAATGALVSAIGATRPAASSMAATGALTSDLAIPAKILAAGMAATGALTADLGKTAPLAIAMAATSSLASAAAADRPTTASMAAAGALVAAFDAPALSLAASMAAAGALAAGVGRTAPISLGITTASGALTADANRSVSLAADMAGLGALAADAAALRPLAASLAAVSALGAEVGSSNSSSSGNEWFKRRRR